MVSIYAAIGIAAMIIAAAVLFQYSQNNSVDEGNIQSGNGQNPKNDQNHPPAIALLYPQGGETLSGIENVQWSASDMDNDSLSISIRYTTDPEPWCSTCPPQKWHGVSNDEINDGIYKWDTTQYGNEDNILLKVIVNDGATKREDVSNWFSISN